MECICNNQFLILIMYSIHTVKQLLIKTILFCIFLYCIYFQIVDGGPIHPDFLKSEFTHSNSINHI